jgi:MFS family permease
MNSALREPASPPDDMEDLAIPLLVKLAGGMAMVTGAFTIGLAIQTSLIFRMSGRIPAIIAAMVILGIAAVVTGWGTVQGRGASAIAAAAMSGLVALLGTAWAITGFLSGVFSPLSFAVVFFATGAAVLVALAIAPARKVSAARERLRAQGYDFGL